MDMTIRKIGEKLGVSRRAIQGYENAGLISASGKNERGHLLYDETAQERIGRIKFYQRIGFSIEEITGIIDASDELLKMILKKQLYKLETEKKNIESLIDDVKKLIEKL